MDFPVAALMTPKRLVVPNTDLIAPNVAAANGATFTANDAVFIPFQIQQYEKVTQLGLIIGVQSGNIDVGIYTQAGTRLGSSGSTAVGAAGLQVFNITDIELARGRYLFGIALNNNTAQLVEVTPRGGASAAAAALVGAFKQATAFALPATATLAVPTRTTLPLAFVEFE